jgi:sulfate permease, SulP family
VLVLATVEAHGLDGLILATMISGVFLLIIGFARLGTYIKFIPYPVTVGFTAGIGIIIFASQIKELLGLTLPGKEPGELVPKLEVLGGALGTVNPVAVAIGTIATIVVCTRVRGRLPGMLIAVVLASVVSVLLGLSMETIGTRFGGVPQSCPVPALPELSMARIEAVLPNAFAFALLGSIESLLSAVVADGMTGRRHRSNCELVAQGVANIGSGLFGGICVTGTIARTATNVRAGARGPISGMLHAAFLLGFMLLAAPLASYIPLAALAGVLAVVAWNMVERDAFVSLIRSSRGDALVLLVTLLLTVFRDLTEGIVVGVALGAMLFIHRMAHATRVEAALPLVQEDVADDANGGRTAYDASLAADPDLIVYRLKGAFFFGAAATVGAVLDRIADHHRAFILDFSDVPFLDSTGANTIAGAVRKAERARVQVYLTGTSPDIRRTLRSHGLGDGKVKFIPEIEAAVAMARREVLTAA